MAAQTGLRALVNVGQIPAEPKQEEVVREKSPSAMEELHRAREVSFLLFVTLKIGRCRQSWQRTKHSPTQTQHHYQAPRSSTSHQAQQEEEEKASQATTCHWSPQEGFQAAAKTPPSLTSTYLTSLILLRVITHHGYDKSFRKYPLFASNYGEAHRYFYAQHSE